MMYLFIRFSFKYFRQNQRIKFIQTTQYVIYKGHLKGLWTGGSALLLCRGRLRLLCQDVLVGVT